MKMSIYNENQVQRCLQSLDLLTKDYIWESIKLKILPEKSVDDKIQKSSNGIGETELIRRCNNIFLSKKKNKHNLKLIKPPPLPPKQEEKLRKPRLSTFSDYKPLILPQLTKGGNAEDILLQLQKMQDKLGNSKRG